MREREPLTEACGGEAEILEPERARALEWLQEYAEVYLDFELLEQLEHGGS